MPWVRFDDQFATHRKVAGLSDAAFRLHVSAIFWCARNLMDGFLPAGDLDDVCARVRTPQRFAAELVVRGLWHLGDEGCQSDKCPAPDNADGWVIHDYLEYQPSAERVRAERKATAARQQKWRDQQKQRRNGVSNARSNGVSNPPGNTAPTRPPLKGEGEGAAPLRGGATPPPTHTTRGGQLLCAIHPLQPMPCIGCRADALAGNDDPDTPAIALPGQRINEH